MNLTKIIIGKTKSGKNVTLETNGCNGWTPQDHSDAFNLIADRAIAFCGMKDSNDKYFTESFILANFYHDLMGYHLERRKGRDTVLLSVLLKSAIS
jgi:hypothetical protein